MAYCEAFGLERGQSLENPYTRKLRAWSADGVLPGAMTVARTVTQLMCHRGPSQTIG